MDRETDGRRVGVGGREDSMALDVGDGTFAVFLHGDVHVGGGHVALPSALLPHSGPAVAFVLLDDVQHLAQSEEATVVLRARVTLKLQDSTEWSVCVCFCLSRFK